MTPQVYRAVRKTSKIRIAGLPLYHIAMGPDFSKKEPRGKARGIIAIGDTALGVIAIGGVARGLIAIGGIAMGGISIGGLSIGLLAIGGGAIGGIAVGGGAVGVVALGGGAVGYQACGGASVGEFVLNAERQDPEAIDFFQKWFSWSPTVKGLLR